MTTLWRNLWIIALILALTAPVRLSQAQSPIRFEPTKFENHFPGRLIFNVRVNSDAPIVTATLHHKLRGEASFTQVTPTFEPAATTVLSYTWKTGKLSVPPGAPIVYYWQVTDADGHTARTDEQTFRYDDVNYDWQKQANDNLSVWWHDRPAEFGQQVFDIANRGFANSARLFEAKLDFPIRIIINNTFAEYKDWSPFSTGMYAGGAFPDLGLTVQIVEEIENQDVWLHSVIPHEITHLYFQQVTYHPLSNPPAWLNEGLAQYFEFVDRSAGKDKAEDIIRDGGLIPLRALTGGFGNVDEYKVALSYAESLSAVTYLIDTYGKDGVSKLLAAFKAGKPYEKAFQASLDRTPEEFQEDWLKALGVPADLYPTPTPWPTLGLIPTVDWRTATVPAQTRTPTPTPTAKPTFTDTPVAIASASTAEPTPVPVATTGNASDANNANASPVLLIGGLVVGVLVIIMIIAARRRPAQPPDR